MIVDLPIEDGLIQYDINKFYLDVELGITDKDGKTISQNALVAPSASAGLSFIQRITVQFNNT